MDKQFRKSVFVEKGTGKKPLICSHASQTETTQQQLNPTYMDQNKPFIIVVDDDNEDRYLLNCSFTDLGLEDNVKFFGDALQFIKYTELISSLNVKPSLIVLDYKMPYMNGKAVVDYLKSKPETASIPVVIFSTTLSEEVKDKLHQLGVSACYEKGEDAEQLSNGLREIVKWATPIA